MFFKKLLFPLPVILAIFTLLYSYLGINLAWSLYVASSHPNLNFFFSLWHFANDNRLWLANIHLGIVLALLGLELLFFFPKITDYSIKKLLWLFGATTTIFSLSYPYLSYDFFYYLFTARMAWHYHINPYQYVPRVFIGKDLMTSLVSQALDSPYPYGQVFLGYTIIPTAIFGDRFLLVFFGLKLLNAGLFFLTGYLFYKLTKNRLALVVWFLNPLLILELLVNSHNDLLMIALFVVALFLTSKDQIKNKFFGILFFFGSIYTKYISWIGLPLFVFQGRLRTFYLYGAATLLILELILTDRPVQSWYYTWIFMFLPLMNLKWYSWVIVNLLGVLLLVNYYFFLATNGWGQGFLIPYPKIWIIAVWICFLVTSIKSSSFITRDDQ